MGKKVKNESQSKKVPLKGQKLNPKSRKIKKQKTQVKQKVKRVPYKPIQNYSLFFEEQRQIRQKKIQKIQKKIVLNNKQVMKAVNVVLQLHEKQKQGNDLLDVGEEFVYLEIVMSKVPQNYSIRPKQIRLKNAIYSEKYNSQFALIVKDPASDFKEKIEDMDIPTIAEVIGFTELDNYPTYKDKRELFYSYDLFFVDHKIYNLIKKQTGQIFYQRKKYKLQIIPFAFDINNVPEYLNLSTYEEYLNDFKNYTYFQMGNGPAQQYYIFQHNLQSTIKIGRVSQNTKEIAENIQQSINEILSYLVTPPAKSKNVRQISIKTAKSMSIPIFCQLTKSEKKTFEKLLINQ